MKIKELRELNTEELNAKLVSLKQELFNLRFSHATGQLANPVSINVCKKDIARVKTLLREKEMSGEVAVKNTKKGKGAK